MTAEKDPAAIGGLRFFGKISASVSHEIKNVLAVIRESAGLMEDLLAMHRKGLPLDPEKFAKLADRVGRQTVRADAIVKNMNRFAHSVDEPVKLVEVGELLLLITDLGQRLASMKGMVLATAPPETALTVRTSPFSLELALWTCLEFALGHGDENKRITLSAKPSGPGVEVVLGGLAAATDRADPDYPAELLDAVQCRLQTVVQTGNGAMTLLVPDQQS